MLLGLLSLNYASRTSPFLSYASRISLSLILNYAFGTFLPLKSLGQTVLPVLA